MASPERAPPCSGPDAVRAVGGFEGAWDYPYADEVFFSKICLRYPTYLMKQHFDLLPDITTSSSAVAAPGEYVRASGDTEPGAAALPRVLWLLRFAAEEGQDDVAGLVRDELETNYGRLAEQHE